MAVVIECRPVLRGPTADLLPGWPAHQVVHRRTASVDCHGNGFGDCDASVRQQLDVVAVEQNVNT